MDIPTKNEPAYIDGRMYYGNGIRIKTEIKIDEFINRWNYRRYDKEQESPFKRWKAIKPAETQYFINPIPIGYLSGTTENGYYDTVKESLRKEYKNEIELSYQTVYQPGVSQRVWNSATKMARETNADPNSREHRRVKFGMAPSALVIFARDQRKVDQLTRSFMEKYGEIEEGKWPKMEDYSRMRFIPITNNYIHEQEYRDNLFESLHHQAASKAGEVTLELGLTNIREKKDYLKNNSLEQIIHSICKDDDEDIPVFKHITMRWNNREESMNYEVAIASALLEEAKEKLKNLREYLIGKYGEKVKEHFDDYQNENGTPIKKRSYSHVRGLNNEIKEFIKKTNTKDKLSRVLIEGMEKVKERHEEDKRGAMLVKTKNTEEEKNSKLAEKEKEVENEESTIGSKEKRKKGDEEESLTTNNSSDNDNDSEVLRRAWDEISLAAGYPDCIQATEYEQRVTINTLGSSDITLEELEEWKNRNSELIPELIGRSSGREYKALKKIVNKILLEREREKLKDNKFSILGEVDEDDDSSDSESEGTSHPKNEESLPQEHGKGRGA